MDHTPIARDRLINDQGMSFLKIPAKCIEIPFDRLPLPATVCDDDAAVFLKNTPKTTRQSFIIEGV